MPAGIYPFLLIGHRHTLEQHRIMGEIDEQLLELINYPKDKYIILKGKNNVN